MMLVEHDVEAQLIGQHPLVNVAIVEPVRHVRIAELVGQGDAQGRALRAPGVRIGFFGEMIDTHGIVPLF